MTVVVLAALGVGLGVIGIIVGCRPIRAPLHGALMNLTVNQGTVPRRAAKPVNSGRLDLRAAMHLSDTLERRNLLNREFQIRLALANISLVEVCTRCLVCLFVGTSLPVAMWLIVSAGGVRVPGFVILIGALALGVGGAVVPIAELNADAKRSLRQAKRVICSFLDLVVLGLAGGMGIESALLTAAQLGENPVSRRMSAMLSLSRDTGEPPWDALRRLGESLGIDELSDLAAAAGLAGTEGARVRATLAARAATIRRHEPPMQKQRPTP